MLTLTGPDKHTEPSLQVSSPEEHTHSRSQHREVKATLFTDVLGKNQFTNAKMKNLKIYSEQEINGSPSQLEKKRRRFWNEKAEQLATSAKTSKCNNTTISGIIHVSWTLRKTSLIEEDAKKLLRDEKTIFENEDLTTTSRLGQPKKETLANNLDRMTAAHLVVEAIDAEIQECQTNFSGAKTHSERDALNKEYKRKKIIMDGAFTELKRAQEATVKSMKVKRQQIDSCLKSINREEDSEQSGVEPSSIDSREDFQKELHPEFKKKRH